MGVPKLTYFDFDGGRGEAARLAFAIGGVSFIDDRVPFAAWKDRKPHTPFGGLPVLEVDGRSVAQSNGINRYVGKLVGLYPADPWQAARCDEAMDAGLRLDSTSQVRIARPHPFRLGGSYRAETCSALPTDSEPS
jgi:glutathione S-transferase